MNTEIKPAAFETAGPMVEQPTGREPFAQALARFVRNVNEVRRFYYETNYPNIASTREVLEVQEGGKKYLRLVLVSPQREGRSAFGFIDAATGDVLKADGWKRPAKGVRGSIFSDSWDGYGCSYNGPHYAR